MASTKRGKIGRKRRGRPAATATDKAAWRGILSVRITDEERERIERAAAGQPLSAWARERLLEAAR